jgi:DNA-binding NtrC family response regulator
VQADALRSLEGYDWPGNLRELRNVLERAVILAGDGPIGPEDVHIPARARLAAAGSAPLAPGAPPANEGTLSETEERMVRDALERAGGNKSKAARLLGITRRALYGRLERYGIDPEA